MRLSGYLSGVLFGVTALLPISAQSMNTNKMDALGSSLNWLLPRKDGSSSRTSPKSGSSSTSSPSPRKFSSSSKGGGSPAPLGSNSRFPGRQNGGGGRGSIYGTSRCGSGIHGTDAPMSVENVDFAFGFWPVWYPDGYCGTRGYEYPSSTLNDTRPGNEMVAVDVQPNSAYIQVSAEEKNHTYYMFGDKDSIVLIMGILVLPKDQGGCNSFNATLANWTLSTVAKDRFEPGHVLQWYRSSSFALAYTGYNNSYAYPPFNTTSPVNMSDPLPSVLLTSEYLSCLNKTIGDALPIMDAEESTRLSADDVINIIRIAGYAVLALVVLIAGCCVAVAAIRRRLALRRGRERKGTSAHMYPTVTPGSRGYKSTLGDLHSYRRSSLTSSFSLSSTLHNTSTPTSPEPSLHPSSPRPYSQEADEVVNHLLRTLDEHRYNDLLTAPLSPHFSSRDRSNRMSVSSESSEGGSRCPSPGGSGRRLLA